MKIREASTKRLVNGKLIDVVPGEQKIRPKKTDKQRLAAYMGERREAMISQGVNPAVFQTEKRVQSRWV